jgi:hypothetical protein
VNFISTTNTVGNTNGNMDNVWLLNEEGRESEKPDPEYKDNPNPPTVPQKLNTTPQLFMQVRKCFFEPDVDRVL